jgi:hypothetical protein
MSTPTPTSQRTRRRLGRTLSRSRWGEYDRLLALAVGQGYRPVGVEDWLADPDLEGPLLLLRHDVDQHPTSALRMAAIEAEYGIRSTWYFRWRTARDAVVEQIRDAGHAIGLHYETLTREVLGRGLAADDAPALVEECRETLRLELDAFAERFGPARSACPHGDTRVPGVHNGVLLLGQDWAQYGLRWDANAAMRGRRIGVWLTDRSVAEGRWKDGMDPIDLFIDRRAPILAVVHPNNWVSGMALWSDRVGFGAYRTGSDRPPLPSAQARRQAPQT